MTRSVPILALILLMATTAGSPGAETDHDHDPPRVTLVLSGGGARGAAHIGVLKVIEELRIPVDLVVGTSMGAIVGGLYATGWSAREIEELFAATDFRDLFVDYPEREDKSFRRKQDDREFLIPLKMRFKGIRPYIPKGALGGQRLESLLRTLEIESTTERDFDDFPIPYRAVAANLTTGQAVVIGEGSLATAMRASMSIAGVFEPVIIDGDPVVDGGAAANLPVGIAQELGAGTIVAVDITTPLSDEDELTSLFSVFDQITGFLTVGNRLDDIARLAPGDILIQPELGEITFASFDRIEEAIEIGESAARASAGTLREFSLDEDEYEAYRSRRRVRSWNPLVPDEVRIENTSWVADEVVERKVTVEAGEPLDVDVLNRDIRRLHALEYFDTIRTRFDSNHGREVLTIDTPRQPYGRGSLQFGVNFHDDLDGEAGYAFSLRHQVLAVNKRGGEWENIAQIGDTTVFDTFFYQPLDYGMKWFVEPGFSSKRRTLSLWADGNPVAEFRVGTTGGRLSAGRVLGRWGEARLTAFRSNSTARLRTGPPIFQDFNESDGGARFRFRVDTRDDVIFPERGLNIDATYSWSREDFGADADYEQVHGSVGGAITFGKNTFVPRVEYGEVIDGPILLTNTFTLGGLLRLSGLGNDELLGSRYSLAVLLYYRELGSLDLGALSPKLYVGCSLEAGSTWLEGEGLNLDASDHSGAVFVGARTPLGPIYLGYAMADGGRTRIHLNIGTSF